MAKKNTNGSRLCAKAKHLVIKMLSEYEYWKDIQSEIKTRFGQDITQQGIHWYTVHKSHAEAIRKGREEFLASLNDIPISNRAYRLREIQKLYMKIRDGYDEEVALLQIGVVTVHRFDPHAIVKIINQAMKEMDSIEHRDKGRDNETAISNSGSGNLNITYNLTGKSDDELARRNETIERDLNSIILGKGQSERFKQN